MLIAHQKFRSHMIGHCNRLCHIIMHNMRETWGLIYLRKMRTLPMPCHVLLLMQCHHACIAWHVHAGKPPTLCICVTPEITYEHAIHPSQTILSKLTASHFWHPKYENCKPECAEKDSHCHAQREQGQVK